MKLSINYTTRIEYKVRLRVVCFYRVSSYLPYFVSDCLSVQEETLLNAKPVQLTVITIEDRAKTKM